MSQAVVLPHDCPRFVGRLDEVEQVDVAPRDRPLVGERIEVDHPLPERPSEQEDRQARDLAGLNQG